MTRIPVGETQRGRESIERFIRERDGGGYRHKGERPDPDDAVRDDEYADPPDEVDDEDLTDYRATADVWSEP